MVGLKAGQFPDPFPVGLHIGIGLDQPCLQQPQTVLELGDGEVDPGDAASVVLSPFQQGIELDQEGLEQLEVLSLSLLPGLVPVAPVDQLDVLGVQIPVHAVGHCQVNLLLSIAAQQLRLPGPVHNVDEDGLGLGHHLVAVDQVGEVDDGVLLQQLRLVDAEPLVVVGSVLDLLVGSARVLQQHADALGQASDGPVPQSHLVVVAVHVDWMGYKICQQFDAGLCIKGGGILDKSLTSPEVRYSNESTKISHSSVYYWPAKH